MKITIIDIKIKILKKKTMGKGEEFNINEGKQEFGFLAYQI